MKKRIISLLLAAAMTFSLTACGGNSSDDKKEETKTENTDNKETPEVDTIHWARANSLFISLADQVIHSVHVGLSTVHFADHLHRNLTRAETVSLSRLSTTLKDRFGVGLQLLSRNRQIKGTFQRTLRGFFFSHFLLLIKVFGMNKVTSNGSIVREPSPRPIKNLSSVRSILLFAQKRLIIATVATKL